MEAAFRNAHQCVVCSVVPPGEMKMIGGRGSWVGLSTRLKLYRNRRFCTKMAESSHRETDSSVSRYDETYKKLDKLDFVTAAKILFTEPPKNNKFGFDWHVVQFIIVCLPSLAVYLVAQYARRKMKIMDAELGDKKRKQEEEIEKEEAKQKALEEEAATKSHAELMEMKHRLGKIEETIQEIVLETKKPSGNAPSKTQEDQSTKLSLKEESKPARQHRGNVQKPGDGPHSDDYKGNLGGR